MREILTTVYCKKDECCGYACKCIQQALRQTEKERDEALICIQIVRERVRGIIANWQRPPGGQQAGVPDKSIGLNTCYELLRSLGPDQGSYTYEEWRKLVDRIADLEKELNERKV